MNELGPLPNLLEFASELKDSLLQNNLFPVGLILTFLVMLTLHGLFVLTITVLFHRLVDKYVKPGSIFWPSLIYFVALNLIFISHAVDIVVWTYVASYLKAVPNVTEAFYFAGEMYTTLGFGHFNVNEQWRVLPILIAISGIFSASISGAALYSMLRVLLAHQKINDQEEPLG